MIQDRQLLNYVGGEWRRSRTSEFLDVRNPATAETIVRVPLTPPGEVDEAVLAAQTAWADWRRTPPTERIQYLFKLKRLLDEHFDEIARLAVDECGYEAQAGNIGIYIGVAAPMAFFPFSGWKESFFGDMHAQGRDAIEFYTQKKVVVERWPREWSRKF